ncbi:MAG: formate dehydrogenase subunit gamma [bacterium]
MKPDTAYLRWTLNERIQHWVLASSFFVLVVTGFQLRYPNVWWAKLLSGGEFLFNLRGVLHRTAGAIMLGIGFYHIVYMAATSRGLQLSRYLIPKKQDLNDLTQYLGYNFGLKKHPPKFGHFNYMEKVEYFAVIWGTVIMGITGLMLWFETFTLTLFPKWSIDLLTVIHLYEAWLATLAIVVWHFYYVIFNPDVYPINTCMFDGRMSDRELRHEHTLLWQALQEQQSQHEQTKEDMETN